MVLWAGVGAGVVGSFKVRPFSADVDSYRDVRCGAYGECVNTYLLGLVLSFAGSRFLVG